MPKLYMISQKTHKLFHLLIFTVLIFTLSTFSIHNAHATSNTLDATFCATMGGTWNTDTCTITNQYTIPPDEELIIPSGTDLVISNTTVI